MGPPPRDDDKEPRKPLAARLLPATPVVLLGGRKEEREVLVRGPEVPPPPLRQMGWEGECRLGGYGAAEQEQEKQLLAPKGQGKGGEERGKGQRGACPYCTHQLVLLTTRAGLSLRHRTLLPCLRVHMVASESSPPEP